MQLPGMRAHLLRQAGGFPPDHDDQAVGGSVSVCKFTRGQAARLRAGGATGAQTLQFSLEGCFDLEVQAGVPRFDQQDIAIRLRGRHQCGAQAQGKRCRQPDPCRPVGPPCGKGGRPGVPQSCEDSFHLQYLPETLRALPRSRPSRSRLALEDLMSNPCAALVYIEFEANIGAPLKIVLVAELLVGLVEQVLHDQLGLQVAAVEAEALGKVQ